MRWITGTYNFDTLAILKITGTKITGTKITGTYNFDMLMISVCQAMSKLQVCGKSAIYSTTINQPRQMNQPMNNLLGIITPESRLCDLFAVENDIFAEKAEKQVNTAVFC